MLNFNSMSSNNHYNQHLRKFAKENRNSMTKAEACLWKYALSKRQMLGYQFRRQRPISNYIVDFICLPLKLIIEVDGYSHQIQENEIKDIQRQNNLEELDYKILRFKDSEVLNEINEVKRVILVTVENMTAK